MDELRVLLGDDHTVLRQGLRKILEDRREWRVVAEAGNGRDAVREAIEQHPDVAVLDIGMPLLNGIEATRPAIGRDRDEPNQQGKPAEKEHDGAREIAGLRGRERVDEREVRERDDGADQVGRHQHHHLQPGRPATVARAHHRESTQEELREA